MTCTLRNKRGKMVVKCGKLVVNCGKLVFYHHYTNSGDINPVGNFLLVTWHFSNTILPHLLIAR